MRRLIWPTILNANPTTLTRFGRVLHWIATAFTVLVLIACAVGAVLYTYSAMTNPDDQYAWYYVAQSGGIALLSLLPYFAGRALRYIFSGE